MNSFCKQSALVLMFLLLIGLIEASDDHFPERRYLPETRKSRGHREISTRQGRSHPTPLPSKAVNKTEKGRTKINIRKVTAQTGTTAVLNCDETLRNVTVLWLKKTGDSEMTLLTVNETTHTKDKRFRASNEKNPKIWSLHIRYTDNSDSGIYECQQCTDETKSSFVQLILIEAHADIFGGSPKVVKAGSPLRLSCVLRRSIQAPAYIFWYHWDRMINFDLGNGAAVRHGRQGSELIFPRAKPQHAGNYSCVPSNARQASVLVEVLYSEKPAAMQHGKNSGPCCRIDNQIVNMLVVILTFHFWR